MKEEKELRKFSRSFGSALANHASHRLRLEVDDDGFNLQCVFCDASLRNGPHELGETFADKLRECGIRFEVLCQTAMLD